MKTNRPQFEVLESRSLCSVTPVDGVVYAQHYGVPGDGTDQTAALQALIQQVPPNTTIDVEGDILLTRTVDETMGMSKTGGFGTSSGIRLASTGGAGIHGSFAAPLLGRNLAGANTTASEYFSNITFRNTDPDGIDVELEQVQDVTVDHCRFEGGGEGFVVGRATRTNQDIRVRDTTFVGDLERTPGFVGADVSAGRCDFYSVAVYQCGIGLSLGGLVNVFGGHFEVDTVGIQTGNRRDFQGIIQGVDFEADGTAIEVAKPTIGLTLDAINILGDLQHVGPGATWPDYAVDVERGSGAVFMSNVTVAGSFNSAAIRLAGNGPVVCIGVFPANRGLAPTHSTVTWDIEMPLDRLTRIACGI